MSAMEQQVDQGSNGAVKAGTSGARGEGMERNVVDLCVQLFD